MSAHDPGAKDDVWIVYDGECPFCSSFVTLYRLRASGRTVHLVDARGGGMPVAEIRRLGFDLNAGMVVRYRDHFYWGAEAMNLLAILGSDATLFNRLNGMLFRHPTLARLLYPLLVRGRLASLRLLGRSLIKEA
jgi:predicted DCC family thiol-disulfide oxidoreductase YuxK